MGEPCGVVFRLGVNTPATCALRPNHPGGHRTWQQVADEREEAIEALTTSARVVHDLHKWKGPLQGCSNPMCMANQVALNKARGTHG